MVARHDHLNTAISDQGAPAAPGVNRAIQTNVGGITRFNTGAGQATHQPSTTMVQLRAPDGLVQVGAYRTDPTSAAHVRAMAPEAFPDSPEAKALEASAAEDAARATAEEAERTELNRFADSAAEGASMHINSDVAFADRVQVLHQLQTTGTVSEALLNRVADQLHLPIGDAVDALNAVNVNASMQVAALCRAKGVNPDAFNTWMKTTRATEMGRAVQTHMINRDLMGAWSGHVEAYKVKGGH